MPRLEKRLRRVLMALRLGALFGLWRRLRRLDPRLRRREARFRRWNRGAAADEIVLRPGLRLRIDPRSREPFEWFCFRSLEMSRELDAFAREMAPCRSFLDIGACHGIFSLVFAHRRPEAGALAIEPSVVAHAILVENLRRNGLDNVVPSQLACGAAAGRLRMRQVWHHLEALPSGAASGGEVEVPVRSVDELCAELDLAPDIVKIDVEGYELAVLAGARATLARHRPRLFLELHPQRLRELGGSAAEVVQLLTELRYRFLGLHGGSRSARQVGSRESVSRILCIGPP